MSFWAKEKREKKNKVTNLDIVLKERIPSVEFLGKKIEGKEKRGKEKSHEPGYCTQRANTGLARLAQQIR